MICNSYLARQLAKDIRYIDTCFLFEFQFKVLFLLYVVQSQSDGTAQTDCVSYEVV